MRPESRINWRTIEENDFNEVAEALIVRNRTKDGLVAQAVDGRGGDGGIDIDVRVGRSGQLVEILQLKWFPEGFSNKFGARKAQIKESFERACMEEPPVWTLVVPAKLTPNERKSVWAMRKGRKVLIRFVDATELNLLLAEYPEVHDWATREAARDALAIVARDSASLSKPGDLAQEARRLNKRAAGVSAYWGWNWGYRDGVFTEELYAKTADAADREPLSIKVETLFGPDDANLRKRFEDTLAYGIASEPLVLPSHVVRSFTKVGPEWFAEEAGPGELRILPAIRTEQNARVTVTSFDTGGRRLGGLAGVVTHTAVGTQGGSIEYELPGGIAQRWRFPRDASKAGNVDLRFRPAGCTAVDVRKALRFLDTWERAAEISLTVDGRSGQLRLPDTAPDFGLDPSLLELVDDLAFLETELDVSFKIPEVLPGPLERVWVRTIRRILEGRCVVLPNVDGLDVTLNGNRDKGIDMLLSEGVALSVSQDTWCANVLGEELFIDGVAIYHAHVQVDDALEHLKALRAGAGAGRRVHLRPTDQTPFRIYCPDRLGPDTRIVADPWGLTGIPEHKNFGKLTAGAH